MQKEEQRFRNLGRIDGETKLFGKKKSISWIASLRFPNNFFFVEIIHYISRTRQFLLLIVIKQRRAKLSNKIKNKASDNNDLITKSGLTTIIIPIISHSKQISTKLAQLRRGLEEKKIKHKHKEQKLSSKREQAPNAVRWNLLATINNYRVGNKGGLCSTLSRSV